ncbi:MAG: hypothetical protein JWP89_1036 [Schlesneria sp.]|nr:hypothetical protein [Schlesneria sp.]
MDELEQQIEETKLQLEETKLQLSDKLGTLEQQVSQTVETASTAVTATVEAVQGTVDSVTGAVEDAVHGMHNAFDLRLQIEKHPFLVLGGAVVVGYLAAEYFKTPSRNNQPQSPAADFANGDHLRYDNPQPQSYAAPPQQTPQPAPQAPPAPSPLDSLKTLAMSTLMGSMQGIAMRAIPEIVGLVMGNIVGQQAQQHREPPEQESPRARIWPEETPPFASSPLTEQHRSSKLS